MASETCPLCLSAVGRAASFTCPGCKSKYHKDCAADSGECVVNGCKAAAGSKSTKSVSAFAPVVRNGLKPTRTSGVIPNKPSRNVAVGALLVVLIGTGIGYSLGDSRGYDRGYGIGYQEGRSAGYSDGKKEGYAEGFSEGEDAGIRTGLVRGCEFVFEQLRESYLIGYNPFAFSLYSRYGSTYIAKRNCKL